MFVIEKILVTFKYFYNKTSWELMRKNLTTKKPIPKGCYFFIQLFRKYRKKLSNNATVGSIRTLRVVRTKIAFLNSLRVEKKLNKAGDSVRLPVITFRLRVTRCRMDPPPLFTELACNFLTARLGCSWYLRNGASEVKLSMY